MSFFRKSEPVSKRDRGCQWCGELIPAGERHAYVAGVCYDGDFGAYRMHSECQAAAESMPSNEEWSAFEQVRGKCEGR